MPLIVGGAQQFLNNMLPGDRARIGSFHDTVSIIPSQFIDDVYWLNRALVELPYGDKYAMTKLFDGIGASLDALKDVAGRKVVLVLTDGQDTASFTGWRALRKRAVAEEVMIYAIGLEVTYHDGYRWVHTRPDASLQELANETGGGFFHLDETDQLARTFRRVSEELHSQYVLAFEPPARDGKVHQVDVRVGRQQMTARARRSYVAPAGAGQ